MFSWSNSQIIVIPIALCITLALSFIICFFTRKCSKKIRLIPLITISIIVWILEIAKQIINIAEGYDLWAIPLHFCSLFLYIFPLASFAKGKLQNYGSIMTIACFVAFAIIYFSNPTSVISNATDNIFASFHSAHTFIYHQLIFLFFFILIGSKLYTPTKLDYLYGVLTIVIYATISVPVAHFLDVNFCTILSSDIEFLENLRLQNGQILYTFVLIMIGIVGTTLIIAAVHLIHFLKNKLSKKFKKAK